MTDLTATVMNYATTAILGLGLFFIILWSLFYGSSGDGQPV